MTFSLGDFRSQRQAGAVVSTIISLMKCLINFYINANILVIVNLQIKSCKYKKIYTLVKKSYPGLSASLLDNQGKLKGPSSGWSHDTLSFGVFRFIYHLMGYPFGLEACKRNVEIRTEDIRTGKILKGVGRASVSHFPI